MAISASYLFLASMDVDPAREALFNEIYDQEHIPSLANVPGILGATRFRNYPFSMKIGGEVKQIEPSDQPLYVAIYELERPDVLTSPEWAEAVESGRWPTEVRPYTSNRRHSMLKRT